MGYGQSYYTLRSIFCDRVPPPAIHIHLRMFDVASEVPVGNSFVTNESVFPDDAQSTQLAESDKDQFDTWLRELWQDKDQSITRFHETGSFLVEPTQFKTESVEIPMELHRKRDILDAFCFCGPAVAGYVWARLRQALA